MGSDPALADAGRESVSNKREEAGNAVHSIAQFFSSKALFVDQPVWADSAAGG